ncbi:MAG TPA: hypothetical protein VMW48_14960 [Vicinamibacterales bacterium]|nr:hypothetical protein [Vicinamibacterales bacterium]
MKLREPRCIQFGVEAFKNYVSDTAYLVQAGLASQGYTCYGRRFPGKRDCVDMREICHREWPSIVFCEEWNTWNPEMPQPPSKDVGFKGYEWLGQEPGILRATKHADPWGHPEMHARWHKVFQPHAVLVRYEIDRCMECAPWADRSKLVRIWHSLTREYCLPVSAMDRNGVCLLSGAAGAAVYPLRFRIWNEVHQLPEWERTFTIRPHHHWSREGGSAVPAYMRKLARYKVAFVGCSRYHVAFKKHYEATAAGCIVVTNLPTTDRVPVIDENLVRVPDDVTAVELRDLVHSLAGQWDVNRQRELAQRAIDRYDYRVEAARIAGILAERWRQEVA